MRIFCKYHIRNKSATSWHHVQIHKKATSLQHIDNRWLRGICSPATGAKICAKTFICLYAKMAKMSDFSNHNIFAYMLASCANLNFHPVQPCVRKTLSVSPTAKLQPVTPTLKTISSTVRDQPVFPVRKALSASSVLSTQDIRDVPIPTDLSPLSAQGVGRVLASLNMACYISKFQEEQIDGAILMELDETELKSLNISPFHVVKLIKVISGWRPNFDSKIC